MEPLRPSDFDDGSSTPEPVQPTLGALGWVRFVWRQLTSMKTALFLLLLLALAAIPGSLVPQRSSDPNGVIRYEREDPDLFALLDSLQLFDTYSSVWFSAIYILLFISLVGCIIPRTTNHLRALKAPPPKTPRNLNRLEGYQTLQIASPVSIDTLVALAEKTLKGSGYRVRRYGNSVAGERGYLRETANLVFHFALVGVLLSLAVGTGFKYSGQRVLVEGQAFTNQLASYDSFTSGAFVESEHLAPYGLRLNSFDATYRFDPGSGQAQPLDFVADISVTRQGESQDQFLRVNQPLDIDGTSVYLLGNGFAPWLTVRTPDGDVVYSQPVVFLPQDANLTSLGVVKVPDGLSQQVGMLGFFYPSAVVLDSGALSSVFPEPDQPVVTLNVYTGDLGLNEGVPRNVYSLDTEEMTQVAGGDTGTPALVLGPGQTLDLPNNLGSITFESMPRFISVDIHRDPTQLPVALSSLLIVAGLVTSLFVVRRRVWIKVTAHKSGGALMEIAGLSRGDDPGLEKALTELARSFGQAAETTLAS